MPQESIKKANREVHEESPAGLHWTVKTIVGHGDMGGTNKPEDATLIRFTVFKSSPKGIDIPTEGIALGSDLPITITTLKGLNT